MDKLILSLALIIFSYGNSLFAQDAPGPAFTMNHLALSVHDVDQAAAFYMDVLNLQEIENRTEREGIRWLSLGNGKELHLISHLTDTVITNKAVHLAFTTSDFDGFMVELNKRSIPYSDWQGTDGKITTRADGIKQVYIQDPDGYWLEVNSVGEQKN